MVLLLGIAGVSGCAPSADAADPMKDATAVLQSVDVGMQLNGDMTSVKSTNVLTLATEGKGKKKTATTTAAFSPEAVADDLPVRVLTSWSAGGKTGTDLADLSGRSGVVEIELTVQNLTQKPADVRYDSAGSSNTQTSLVSVPLTVAASATLTGTEAGDVVVPSPTQATAATTNGIVSRSGSDGSTVQWATVLAPPRLPAASTLRLVVDAEKFVVPEFTITVQPGVAADPSAGGLMTRALNPGALSEIQLLSRTIQLIADVDAVLGEASTTVAQVSTNLETTGKTLGKRTVADLTEAAASLESTLIGVSQQATSLGSQMSSSLQSTQSSLIAVLQSTVASTSAVLGDTTTQPSEPPITGSDCRAMVATATPASTIYGTLMQVVGQLKAYATVNQGCKAAIQQSLRTLVGSPTPDAVSCTGVASLSCAVFAAETSLTQVANDLSQSGKAAVDALDLTLSDDVESRYARVAGGITQVVTAMADLTNRKSATDGGASITDLDTAVTALSNDVQTLEAALTRMNADATTGVENATVLKGQAAALVAQVCGLLADGTLTPDRASALLSHLTTTVPPTCVPLTPAAPVDPSTAYQVESLPPGQSAIDAGLDAQEKAWQGVKDATGTTPDGTGLLTGLSARIQPLRDALAALRATNDENVRNETMTAAAIVSLQGAVDALAMERDGLSPRMDSLIAQQRTLAQTITTAFDTAADAAKQQASKTSADQRGMLGSSLNAGVKDLEEEFGQSSAALSAAAGSIQSSGAAAIDAQKAAIHQAADNAGVSVTSQVTENLRQIAASVSASTSDLGAAQELLAGDLKRVLLDLGTPGGRTGLLGLMATSSATASSANSNLAIAAQTANAYSNVRGQDVSGIQLGAAQIKAALEAQATMPLFHLPLSAAVEHQSVYTFHIGTAQ